MSHPTTTTTPSDTSKFEVNVPLTILIGAVSVILLIVVMVATEAWFRSEEQYEASVKLASSQNYELTDLRTTQLGRLTGATTQPAPGANQAGTVMPIGAAMEMLVRKNGDAGFPKAPPPPGTQLPPGVPEPAVKAALVKYKEQGCNACHTLDGSSTINGIPAQGPTYRDVYGAMIPLENGQTVLGDEAYIRESVRDPQAKIHQGFPVERVKMPLYTPEQINDEDIENIIWLLKSISKHYKPDAAAAPPAEGGAKPDGTPGPAAAVPTPGEASPATKPAEAASESAKPPAAEPEAKPDAAAATKPEQKPDAKPEATPEPKPDAKPENITDPAPAEAKPESKPEAKRAGAPEAKPEAAPEVKKPEPTPENKSEPAPDAKPEVKPEPKPDAAPEAKPEEKPQPKPDEAPAPDPADGK